MMVLDHVVKLPNEPDVIRDAMLRTIRLARRCQLHRRASIKHYSPSGAGGLDPELRRWCATELAAMEFPGYAVGGLSVGEKPADMYRMISATTPSLPSTSPVI